MSKINDYYKSFYNLTLEDLENNLEKTIKKLEEYELPENQIELWAISKITLDNQALTLQLIINLMKTLKINKFDF